jgi:hypothetical protein
LGTAYRYSEFSEPSTCVEAEPPTWGELHPAFISIQRDVALVGDSIARKQAILDAADQLYPLIRAGEIKPQHAVDGLCDVARNHGLLTEAVEEEIGHRLRGEIGAWREAAEEHHSNQPPTRSDAPASLSDDAAWAEFDRRERDRPAPPPPRPRPTPQVTVEAIMVAVSKRGPAALEEAATQGRLARCDAAAYQQLRERIAALLVEGLLP